MKGEFTRTLTVTDRERTIISTFMETMEEVFGLTFEETSEDLVEIMYIIATKNSRAYLCNNKGTIEIKYVD